MRTAFIIDTCDNRNVILKNILKQKDFLCYDFPNGKKNMANVYVFAPNSYLKNEHIKFILPNSYIYAFSLKKDFIKKLKDKNCTVVILSEIEEFINKNSDLTSEGALMHTIRHTNKSLEDLKIIILGFGHLGKSLYKMFSKFNKNIIVGSRKPERFKNKNIIDIKFAEQNLEIFDVIINTIPANVFKYPKIDKNTFILELASNTFPFNYDELKKQNIDFLIAKGIPGKNSKVSAGNILANTILKDLNLAEE